MVKAEQPYSNNPGFSADFKINTIILFHSLPAHLTVTQQGSCNAKQLPFPNREVFTIFHHFRFKFHRQLRNLVKNKGRQRDWCYGPILLKYHYLNGEKGPYT